MSSWQSGLICLLMLVISIVTILLLDVWGQDDYKIGYTDGYQNRMNYERGL